MSDLSNAVGYCRQSGKLIPKDCPKTCHHNFDLLRITHLEIVLISIRNSSSNEKLQDM